MPILSIPNSALPGFKIISKMEKEQVQILANFLKEFPIGESFSKIETFIAEELKISGARNLARTLLSFSELVDSKFNDGHLVEYLLLSYHEQVEDVADVSETNLKNSLQIFFSNYESLTKTHKAASLLGHNQNIFTESKIVTDIRLLFNDDIQNSKRNGLVVHQLLLETIQGERGVDVYVSLDLEDLKKLKDQIERAMTKEETIRKDYAGVIDFITMKS